LPLLFRAGEWIALGRRRWTARGKACGQTGGKPGPGPGFRRLASRRADQRTSIRSTTSCERGIEAGPSGQTGCGGYHTLPALTPASRRTGARTTRRFIDETRALLEVIEPCPLPVLDPSDRRFPELDRVGLFRYCISHLARATSIPCHHWWTGFREKLTRFFCRQFLQLGLAESRTPTA